MPTIFYAQQPKIEQPKVKEAMSHLHDDDVPENGRGEGEGEVEEGGGSEDNVNGEDGQTGDEVSQGPGDHHSHRGIQLTVDGLEGLGR